MNKKRMSFKEEMQMIKVLFRSIPLYITIMSVLTVIIMNILASITILSLPWIAINAGVFVSWLFFLIMDLVTKHFGLKAGNLLSLLCMICNTIIALLLFVFSKVAGNPKYDLMLSGQWSVFFASTIAFVLSAFINNGINVLLGKLFTKNPDGKTAYVTRTYVSTLVGQIVDNFTFVFLAFVIFPLIPTALNVKWTIWQCIGCSVTCALVELLFEVIFSPIGYKICKKWRERNLGKEYIEKYETT